MAAPFITAHHRRRVADGKDTDGGIVRKAFEALRRKRRVLHTPLDYPTLLSTRGIPLTSLGLRETALTRADALAGVDILRNAGTVILGGDVYNRCDGRLEPAYSNWYANPKPGEDRMDYFRRSWIIAEKYIKAYPDPPGIEPLFCIVPGDDLHAEFGHDSA